MTRYRLGLDGTIYKLEDDVAYEYSVSRSAWVTTSSAEDAFYEGEPSIEITREEAMAELQQYSHRNSPLLLKELPDGLKIEDQNYQRELSKQYISLRHKKAEYIVKAAELGQYDPPEEEWKAAKFIAEDKCVASRYLSFKNSFMLCSAISDYFDLPFFVLAESDGPIFSFPETILDLGIVDSKQAMKIWDWCLDTFQPYLEYVDDDDKCTLTSDILNADFLMTNKFLEAVIDYMEEHPAFVEKLILNGIGLSYSVDDLIIIALERGNYDLARKILESLLHNQNLDTPQKVLMISKLMKNKRLYRMSTSVELFREHLFPVLCEQTDSQISCNLLDWQKELEEIQGKDTEKAFRYNATDAIHEPELPPKEGSAYDMTDSTKLYQFCMVSIDFPQKPFYYYFPGSDPLAVGDKVCVPFGAKNEEKIGVVVSVGECYAFSLPCPIDKMKTVIRKV